MTKSSLNPEITPDDHRQDRFHGQKSRPESGFSDLSPRTGIQGPPEGRLIPETTPERVFDPLGSCPPHRRARYEATARGAAKGSLPKSVKLKCLDCCGWEHQEAKECEMRGCPLWLMNRRVFATRERSAS